MINGNTKLLAHIGYPTSTFKAPLIYNPYFESIGENAVVVPMGVTAEDFASAFPAITRCTNFGGALITMPHKVAVIPMLDEVSTAARIAGACNAVRRRKDGALIGDLFDGEGFVRGLLRKGRAIADASALVVGSGGVGSAIAASLAGHGLRRIGLYDVKTAASEALAKRLAEHHRALDITISSNDPAGFDIIVNATPLGMKPGDAMPMDITRIASTSFVGEVVMKAEITAFLAAARARGAATQVGIDMLFEQIPAYLEFFDLPSTTAENLRNLAKISY